MRAIAMHRSRARRVVVTILSLLLLLLLLAACGGDDDDENGAAQTGGEEALRVAFLLPGPVTDRGYNADGQRAANMIRNELGADVTVSESVQVPNQTDVYRQFANRGFDLVIGWGGQFTDGAVAVAEEFPDVNFLVVNSNASNGSNLASMDTAIEQWQFVGGYVLARLSKKGVVGWVGGGCFPATAANLHGTEQGARYANKNIRFRSTFTGDFEDPTKARQAAEAMVDQGADAVSGNLNNGWFGIYRAARQGGNLPVVTEWVDNHQVSPDVIASSILKSQARFVTDIARAAQDGTFEGKFYKETLPEDWGPAVANTELLPDDIYNDALEVQEKIVSGEIKPKHDESCPG
jgi:basic membrane protein A and related proteins